MPARGPLSSYLGEAMSYLLRHYRRLRQGFVASRSQVVACGGTPIGEEVYINAAVARKLQRCYPRAQPLHPAAKLTAASLTHMIKRGTCITIIGRHSQDQSGNIPAAAGPRTVSAELPPLHPAFRTTQCIFLASNTVVDIYKLFCVSKSAMTDNRQYLRGELIDPSLRSR